MRREVVRRGRGNGLARCGAVPADGANRVWRSPHGRVIRRADQAARPALPRAQERRKCADGIPAGEVDLWHFERRSSGTVSIGCISLNYKELSPRLWIRSTFTGTARTYEHRRTAPPRRQACGLRHGRAGVRGGSRAPSRVHSRGRSRDEGSALALRVRPAGPLHATLHSLRISIRTPMAIRGPSICPDGHGASTGRMFRSLAEPSPAGRPLLFVPDSSPRRSPCGCEQIARGAAQMRNCHGLVHLFLLLDRIPLSMLQPRDYSAVDRFFPGRPAIAGVSPDRMERVRRTGVR